MSARPKTRNGKTPAERPAETPAKQATKQQAKKTVKTEKTGKAKRQASAAVVKEPPMSAPAVAAKETAAVAPASGNVPAPVSSEVPTPVSAEVPAPVPAPAPVSAEEPAPVPASAPVTNGKAPTGAAERFEQSFEAVGRSARAVNAKLIDIAQANVNSGLEFARDLAGARTPMEVLRLQMTYWHECFDTFETQAQELRALSAESVAATSAPIRAQLRRGVRK